MQTVLHKLHSAFRRKLPGHAIFGKLLHGRSQLGLMQREIIDAADTQDAHAGEGGADAVHERAAGGAEVVGHGVVLAGGLDEDGARLAEGLQGLAAAQVLQVRVVHGEVGRVHRRRELVAVGAVADEGPDESWAVRGLSGVETRCQKRVR